MGILDWLFPPPIPTVRELTEARDVMRLLELLQQQGSRDRKRVVGALWEVGDERAVGPLIACLEDSDADIRMLAAMGLGRLGDARAVEPLIALLANKSWPVRQSAVQALGRIRHPRAVAPLAGVMMRDESSQVRRECAFALEVIGGSDADAALASEHGQAALAIDYCDKCAGELEPIGIPAQVRSLQAYKHVIDIGSEAVPQAVKEDPFLFRGFLCRACDMAFCPQCCVQEQLPSDLYVGTSGRTAPLPTFRCPRCGEKDLLPAYRPTIRRRLGIRNRLAVCYGVSERSAELSPKSQ